jgi:hypothetical protein
MAGEDVHAQRRLMAPLIEVRVGTLLDLVIEDYKRSCQKTIGHLLGQIKNSLRPYFGDMLAARVDTDEIDKWIRSPGQSTWPHHLRGGRRVSATRPLLVRLVNCRWSLSGW